MEPCWDHVPRKFANVAFGDLIVRVALGAELAIRPNAILLKEVLLSTFLPP